MTQKTQFNMHDAKSQLSKLVEMAEAGEEVVIARDGRPVAKLVPVEKRFPVQPDFLEGKIEIMPGFDEMDAEIERSFYEEHPGDPLFQKPEDVRWPTEDDVS